MKLTNFIRCLSFLGLFMVVSGSFAVQLKTQTMKKGMMVVPLCPAGWTQVSYEKASGHLSCVPREPQIKCPYNTQYFYNKSQCMAGCRPIVR